MRPSDHGGFAFHAKTPHSIPAGDSISGPIVSGLLLFENDIAIGPGRSLHSDIAVRGKGAFSHWGDSLIFSTTDNSDPRSNGRRYSVAYDHKLNAKLKEKVAFQLQTNPSAPTQMFQISLGRDLTKGGDVEKVCEDIRNLADATLTEEQRFFLAERLAFAAYPKYKFPGFSRLIFEDEEFIAYYSKIMDPGNWHSFDRKYTLNQLLRLVDHIDGDVAECGTYKGASAYLMCTALAGTTALVHLFDSFEGLAAPLPADGAYWQKGGLATSEDSLRQTLQGLENYRVYKGWIPDRFAEVADRTFRFIHIDVDLYEPTLASLQFFYPRLAPGGIILLDDHGFKSCPGAKLAADEFFAGKPERIALLPSGQAMTIKH